MSQSRTIKPIETRYHGCRFRSRLEARWAVFFDQLRIPWQYEVEGFELGNGLRYLPDFYLLQQDVFVEIKPSLSCLSKRDWDKLALFIDHKNTLLACGMPGTEQLYLFEIHPLGLGGQGDVLQEFLADYFEDSPAWEKCFRENFDEHVVVLIPNVVFIPSQTRADYLNSESFVQWGFIFRSWVKQSEVLTRAAVSAAKSARFEWGETGGR